MTDPARLTGAVLTIDLEAIVTNWRRLRDESGSGHVAAVVKADAYGLGVAHVVPALHAAGCRHFFVAHLIEALEVVDILPRGSFVAVLSGLNPGAESACAAAGVIPVLNSLGQARRWIAQARIDNRRLPAILQVDSGMSRLGLPPHEAAELAADQELTERLSILAVMSHLACADEPGAPANLAQAEAFGQLADLFPGVPRSLANSGGCLLGERFAGDIARPGIALYGGDPATGDHAPFAPVVRLEAAVIQMREIPAGTGVGYGMTWHAPVPTRLATIGVGYADGWLRSLSGQGAAWFGEARLPIVGRVSMDSIIVDISALPEGALAEGDMVELIGPHQTIDDVAHAAGTISYEILTSLGQRYHRVYRPAAAQQELAA